jgi:hypothetical protein
MHVEPSLSSPPWPLILGRPHSFGALHNNSLLHWTSIGPRDCNYLEIYMQPSLTYSKRLGNIPSMAQTFYTFLTTNHVFKLIMRAAPLSHYRPKPFVSTDGCRLLPTAICRHRPLPFLWCHFCSPFQLIFKKKQGYSLAKFRGFGGRGLAKIETTKCPTLG